MSKNIFRILLLSLLFVIQTKAVAQCSITLHVSAPGGSSICPGQSAGLVALASSTYPITSYSWTAPYPSLSSYSAASTTASPTVTTTYTVTVTNSIGCTKAATIKITVNPNPTVSVTSFAICQGASQKLTASGAQTYTWSPSTDLSATTGNTVTATPTVTMSYTVTGTSAQGCTATAVSTVTVNPNPVVTVNSIAICQGGTAVLTANASIGGDSFTWLPHTGGGSPITTLAVAQALPGGGGHSTDTETFSPSGTGIKTYTVTATSPDGCKSSAVATVTINPLPTVAASCTNTSICQGSTTVLTATGAQSYTWVPATAISGSAVGATVTANPTVTTTYTVTGTSAQGCVNTDKIKITVQNAPNVSVTSFSICLGSSQKLTASGAQTYSWSPSTYLSPTNGNTVTATPTVTGTIVYTVTGTAANGCTATAVSTLTVNPNPVITVNSATICPGASAILNASSSIGGASFSWNPHATLVSPYTTATETASPNATTSYTVTGTTAVGCTATAVSTVSVNALPAFAAGAGSSTVCPGSTTVLLAESFDATAHNYSWAPASAITGPNTGTMVIASPSVTTTYTVTAFSVQGCTNTATVKITIINAPHVSVNSVNMCKGDPPQKLTATGAQTYTWSPATYLSSTSGSTVTVAPGAYGITTYTVTGIAANGCTATAVSTVTLNSDPSIAVNSATICAGGSTVLSATSSISGTAFSWNPHTGMTAPFTAATETVAPSGTGIKTYTVTGTSPSGCTATAVSSILVNPLPNLSVYVGSNSICPGVTEAMLATGGATYTWTPATAITGPNTGSTVIASPNANTTYTVVSTGTDGCTNKATVHINIMNAPVVTVNSATVCSGGTVKLTANGAATYTWAPAATLIPATGHTVNATPSSTTIYTVTGQTANTCTAIATSTVTVPFLSVSGNTVICSGQHTVLTAIGMTTYTWSSNAGSAHTSSVSVIPPGTGATYTVNGSMGACTAQAVITVFTLATPTITVTVPPIICAGATATVIASGAGEQSYTWTPNIGFSLINLGVNDLRNDTAGLSPPTTTVYTVSGSYFYPSESITCSGAATTTVTVIPSPTLAVSAYPMETLCKGATATLVATGADSYTWTPSTDLSVTTGTMVTYNGEQPITYTVTGTLADGCSATTTIPFSLDTFPQTTMIAKYDSICPGQTDTLAVAFTAIATVTQSPYPPGAILLGGNHYLNPHFHYQWSTGDTTLYLVLHGQTGTFSVTVTDHMGCTTTASITIVPKTAATISLATDTNNVCVGMPVTLVADGASTYSWSPSSGLNATSGNVVTATPTVTTTYSVTGVSNEGCTASGAITVTVNPLPVLTVTVMPMTTLCAGSTATMAVSGAQSYTWTPASDLSVTTGSVVTFDGRQPIVYVVTGTDAKGCSGTDTIPFILDQDSIQYITGTGSLCSGQNDTLRVVFQPVVIRTETRKGPPIIDPATGQIIGYEQINQPHYQQWNADTTYHYQWSNGDTSAYIVVNGPGTYSVLVTDGFGCTATDNITVNMLSTYSVNVTTNPGSTICSSKSITLTASGAQNYTWSPAIDLDTTAGNIVTVLPPQPGGPATTSMSAIPTSYTVIGSGKGGCPDTVVVPIHVDNGSPFIYASVVHICPGETDTLFAGVRYTALLSSQPADTSSYVSQYPTFAWSNGSTSPNPVITQPGTYTVTINDSNCVFIDTITVMPSKECGQDVVTEQDCYCVSSFAPIPGKKYLVSAWVREKNALPTRTAYTYPVVYLDFYGSSITSLIATLGAYTAAGNIIDGWQRIENTFIVPDSAQFMRIRLQNQNPTGDVLFDDIRVFPFDGSMKSYVYDPTTLRLVAELDERNYATKYEYDEDGHLTRIKKETVKGTETVKEIRSASPKK